MQVYRRIANPWMPNGTPNLTNAPSPAYAPGEVGCAINDQSTGNSYLRVWLDSGATSATTIGAVAAGQLAFWKDMANNIVTNDPNFNDTGTAASCVNRVAGIFQTAVKTAAGTNDVNGNPVQYLCDVLIQSKLTNAKAVAGATMVPGAPIIADGTTGGVKSAANVTTANVSQLLGYARGSTVALGLALIEVDIGFID